MGWNHRRRVLLAILVLAFVFRYVPVGDQNGVAVLKQVDPSIEEEAQNLGAEVDRVVERVGLTGMTQRPPSQLSGGQQQRVALARCLVMEPRMLLFDEPLSNCDAKLREQMRIEIRELQQRLGITSVYVTHDQVEAMSRARRARHRGGGRPPRGAERGAARRRHDRHGGDRP